MSAYPLAPWVRDAAEPPMPRSRILGGGEAATLINARDWNATSLGPMAGWSDTLVAFLNLILHAPISSCIYWGPHFKLFYNDEYTRFMGLRHPHAMGRPGPEVWKDNWHFLAPELERCLFHGESLHRNGFLVPVAEDGIFQDQYWDFAFSPIFDNGRIAGIYNTVTNVTAAVLAARERDAYAQRLQQIFDSTSECIVLIDRDWRFAFVNRAGRSICPAFEDLVGRNLWETLPHIVYEGSPNVYHYHRAMDQNLPGEFESFFPAPYNLRLHIQVRPSPDGIILFIQDVTEQRRAAAAEATAAAALLASEEELRWTVALNTQNPWTADPEGNLLSAGHHLEELTGASADRMLGSDWVNFIHPDDAPAMVAAWKHSIATGEPYDIEHRTLAAAGEPRWFRSRAYPRRNAAGAVVKWYGSTEDIDARKRGEEALRTTDKLAAVGRLATSIAHEINNPLEAVTNLLYLARTCDDLPQIQSYVHTAEQELHRAAVIANQTLRFQRQSSAPTALRCEDLIDNCLAVFQGRLHNSAVAATTRIRATEPVTCFEGEIRQVFLNLVGNAIDSMIPGGGPLHLRARHATDWKTGAEGVVLTVADRGHGISPEARKKIFEPFFTTKGLAGTGLGLWVSQEIIARHHGTLRLRTRHRPSSQADNLSEPRRSGTVFTLFLPYAAPAPRP